MLTEINLWTFKVMTVYVLMLTMQKSENFIDTNELESAVSRNAINKLQICFYVLFCRK